MGMGMGIGIGIGLGWEGRVWKREGGERQWEREGQGGEEGWMDGEHEKERER